MRLSLRLALPLIAALMTLAAPAAHALPRGAVHLDRGEFKRAGASIQCGLVDGRWQPGTRRLSYWFVSHAQAARNAKRPAVARRFRRLAAAEGPACRPLRVDLRGARGLAVHGSAKPRAHDLSNLDVVGRRGRVRDAVTAGTANVSRIYAAPGGRAYVLFASPTAIGGGEPIGEPVCEDYDDGDDYGDDEDLEDEEETEERGVDEEDCWQETTPIEYCLLAELDPSTQEPTCVDSTLYNIRTTTFHGPNAAVQFDAAGAVYYMGTASGGTVLRRWSGGETRDYIANSNVLIDDFLVLPDGDVLVSGATYSTHARWVRRIEPSGRVHSLRSVAATFMRLFPDGNAYLGFGVGVQRLLTATDTFDAEPFLDAERVKEPCAEADASAKAAFCRPAGALMTDSVTTADGRVFAVAGPADGGRLVQYFPEPAIPASGVSKVSLAEVVGENIALAGVDEHEQRVLALHDTQTGSERVLIGHDAELDVFHLAYDDRAGRLRFDGLRFADNRYVLGEVDLATGVVTYTEDSATRWTDMVGL